MMFKRSLAVLATATVCIASATSAYAQSTYPANPIRLVVPQSAGSGGDIAARILGDKMSKILGQSIVIENRPGANGVIAGSYVANAKPDGYTVMLGGASQFVFNPGLYKKLPYDPIRDFSYVAAVADTPFVLVASKASGIKSFDDLKKAAAARPGAVTFSSAGVGNSTHLSTEMLAERTGMQLLHVPFNGSGPALSGVLGGQVDLMFSVVGAALPTIQSDSVTPLVVLGLDEIAEAPQIPSVKEVGLELPRLPAWYAVVGPAGMDPQVTKTLGDAVQQALQDPDLQSKFKAQYLAQWPVSAADVQKSVSEDVVIWGELIQKLNLQVD